MILADLGLDDITLAGALLHDAVEDTSVTLADLEARFGPDVAAIVDGVTKLDRLEFDSREAQQAATMRKMLVAMAKDVRVLLIKLADRLHNMRTIASLPEAKQKRIAQETLDIYAPLAHRLGIQDVKWQLEDLAFAVLHPKRYAEIEAMVLQHAGERERYLDEVVGAVRARLEQLHINAEVTGPAEALLVDLREDGRAGQGVRRDQRPRRRAGHRRLGEGLLRRARARSTRCGVRCRAGSRTTSRCPSSTSTSRCTRRWWVRRAGRSSSRSARARCTAASEYGVAAHWGYKEQRNPTEDLVWLQRIVDWQKETTDPTEFMQSLKIDLEQDEVFVFTPKGRVITLPTGATPVDFAYAIHTEVGHRCIGARVNARLGPARLRAAVGRHVRDLHEQGRGRGPEPRLAAVRADAARALEDPAVVLA